MYKTPYPYKPKTVMITGATGDFGKAFCTRFAAIGSKLILVARNEDKARALETEIKERFPQVQIHLSVFDITEKQAMYDAYQSLPEDFQDIDLLINNAGLALGLEPSYACDIEDWETMVMVNNMALIRMSRLVLEGMEQRKAGHIINIGSISGNYPYPGGNVYCATKAFVKQFSLAIRGDLKGTNIRVTNIEPGAVETQFSEVRFKGDKERANSVYANTKNIYAEDVGETVFWAATLPEHVNINRLEVMATVQSFGPNPIERFD